MSQSLQLNLYSHSIHHAKYVQPIRACSEKWDFSMMLLDGDPDGVTGYDRVASHLR